ncbi:hypothetical protein ACFL6M_07630 [Candidatus Eisenbacteria bacterium]|uniref:Glycosyltransferase RgtA/B/C/D-like domain-containing protein n=1 Tax=Eiseniibacteriota bacterium TaxID=2212470 RepID=A0ABV6YM97_UNCEI
MTNSMAKSDRVVGLITGFVAGIISVSGVVRAIAGAWTCDDAFISFRYAKNLVDGLGLVYNAGEPVEGYTNFLWTVIVAAAMKIGLEPVVFAQAAGVLFFAATLALLIRVSWSLAEDSGSRSLLGLGAIGLAVHHHAIVFCYRRAGNLTVRLPGYSDGSPDVGSARRASLCLGGHGGNSHGPDPSRRCYLSPGRCSGGDSSCPPGAG